MMSDKPAEIRVIIDRDLHHRFKVLCVERRTTMQSELVEFIRSKVYHQEGKGKK